MRVHVFYIAIIFLLLYGWRKTINFLPEQVEKVRVDSVLVVKEIPVKKNSFSVVKPIEKIITKYKYISNDEKYKNVISALQTKYSQKVDSLTILKELLLATKIREYKEVFKDSSLIAEINIKTKGTLEKIDFSYVQNPQKFSYFQKTVTKTKIPRFSILVGGKVSSNLINTNFEFNIGYQNKKGSIYEVGITSDNRLSIGYKTSILKR